ncbi:MAG: hypothetical protein ACLSH8_01620 [Zhenhengia sp.]|uniref:hypothetical protein n=1 Tax=Zhenhengia sp. TaxID=2944208 RepID=UPI0029123A0A|nr:hypothetical protein [Clostridiales bacterium]MDU6973077.1 hypothetical protein [Clostridiales bacterium]
MTYSYEFNRSVEELVKEDIESHQKNRKIFEELNAELVAEGKKTPEEAARGITTLKEVESELGENVRKLITLNDDGTLRYIDYYIDDGQGGCYQIMVYQPYNEDLEAVMLSTKIVIEQGNDMIMPYTSSALTVVRSKGSSAILYFILIKQAKKLSKIIKRCKIKLRHQEEGLKI